MCRYCGTDGYTKPRVSLAPFLQNSAITGYATERIELLISAQLSTYTPSFDLRHLLPNFAITGYVTELALNSLPPRICPPN